MQLIQRCSLFALLWAGACGPDTAQESTWMLGTFSAPGVGMRNVAGVTYYEFREDGTLIRSGIELHGTMEAETEPVEYTWARLGDDLIEVQLPEPHGWVDRWHVSPASSCDQIQLYGLHGDSNVKYGGNSLYRGNVCIGGAPGPCPIGSNCDSNITVWCDEPPPPCDDAEAP